MELFRIPIVKWNTDTNQIIESKGVAKKNNT